MFLSNRTFAVITFNLLEVAYW